MEKKKESKERASEKRDDDDEEGEKGGGRSSNGDTIDAAEFVCVEKNTAIREIAQQIAERVICRSPDTSPELLHEELETLVRDLSAFDDKENDNTVGAVVWKTMRQVYRVAKQAVSKTEGGSLSTCYDVAKRSLAMYNAYNDAALARSILSTVFATAAVLGGSRKKTAR